MIKPNYRKKANRYKARDWISTADVRTQSFYYRNCIFICLFILFYLFIIVIVSLKTSLFKFLILAISFLALEAMS